jgi:hypothetical protein
MQTYQPTTTDNQQADSLIESKRPWNDLFSLFPTKRAAYEYFALNIIPQPLRQIGRSPFLLYELQKTS